MYSYDSDCYLLLSEQIIRQEQFFLRILKAVDTLIDYKA